MISARASGGTDAQIASGSAAVLWTKIVAAVDEPGERRALAEGGDVVERHEVDPVELAVLADRLVGDGQVVGRRQALLLRAVARVGLDVEVEQLADERRQRACSSVTDPKPPIEWPRRL